MKTIIAFVLLGLLTYAGVVFLYLGITNGLIDTGTPLPLKGLSTESYISGMKVDAEIYQTVGRLNTAHTVTNTAFGIEIGEPIIEYYYLIPAGEVQKDLSKQKYMLLCVSSKEDLAALDSLTVSRPRPENEVSGKSPLKITGIMTEMNYDLRQNVQYLLADRDELIGIDLGIPTIAYIDNRICPYTLRVHRPGGSALPAIIAGAAMTAAGVGGITLLIIKKHREKSGY